MAKEGWIGVDLDGTLALYDGWKGVDHIGDPVPAMADRVKAWVEDGITVKIFTARVSGRDAVEAAVPILHWTKKHFGFTLEVTNVKDFDMVELWDDRAVSVEENTGRIIAKGETRWQKSKAPR